jgi:hypothetical protein
MRTDFRSARTKLEPEILPITSAMKVERTNSVPRGTLPDSPLNGSSPAPFPEPGLERPRSPQALVPTPSSGLSPGQDRNAPPPPTVLSSEPYSRRSVAVILHIGYRPPFPPPLIRLDGPSHTAATQLSYNTREVTGEDPVTHRGTSLIF